MTTENGKKPQFPMVPQYVQPRPSGPEVWATTGEPTVTGGELVKVEVHHAGGKDVHYLLPDVAISVGKQIADQGHKSKLARHIVKPDGSVG